MVNNILLFYEGKLKLKVRVINDDERMDMLHATKEEKLGKQRIVLNPKINVAVSGIIIQKEEWFQAQFIQSDPE